MDHKEFALALVSTTVALVDFLLKRYQQWVDSAPPTPVNPPPIEITITINQATAPMPTADVTDPEQFLSHLLTIQPDLLETITPATTTSITIHVPPTPRRRRR